MGDHACSLQNVVNANAAAIGGVTVRVRRLTPCPRAGAEILWDCLARRSAARRRQTLAAGMLSSPAVGLRPRRRIAASAHVFAQQLSASAMIPPWLIRGRLDQRFHPIACGTNRHETKAEEPAQTVHAWISIAASPGCWHRQPHFIRRAHPIHDLQEQIVGEAKLHLHDRQRQPLCRPDRDDVAALHLALHVEAGRLPG